MTLWHALRILWSLGLRLQDSDTIKEYHRGRLVRTVRELLDRCKRKRSGLPKCYAGRLT
jgi:hypothetical protein